MPGAVQIDDRRRFGELWKELLFARVGAALAATWGLAAAFHAVMLVEDIFGFAVPWIGYGLLGWLVTFALGSGYVLSLAAPTVIAKRGRRALVVAVAAVLVSYVIAVVTMHTDVAADVRASSAGYIYAWPGVTGPLLGVIGAALGVAEGHLERSVATIYFGLAGGAVAGGVAGTLTVGVWSSATLAGREPGYSATLFLIGPVAATALHLGIGLSLAAGRYVRDLPGRTSA